MAVVKVVGSAFCRPEYGREARLPCYFATAIGGNRDFTKRREYAPLLLGDQDYEKVADKVTIGDCLVVIGGRSRNSCIDTVDPELAGMFGEILHEEGFKAAITALENFGYDTGSTTSSGVSSPKVTTNRTHPTPSEAAKLMNKAEQRGFDTMGHEDLLRIGNHLLQVEGWDGAWQWFNTQFGENFDEEMTHRQLRGIVNKFEDLNHIDVPSSP